MKYGHLIHVEVSANGGAKVVHSYQDELKSLSPSEMKEFVKVSLFLQHEATTVKKNYMW